MLPIYLGDRYRFPMEWCGVPAAAIGSEDLADRIGPRRARPAVAVAFVVCIAGLFVLAHGMKTG